MTFKDFSLWYIEKELNQNDIIVVDLLNESFLNESSLTVPEQDITFVHMNIVYRQRQPIDMN